MHLIDRELYIFKLKILHRVANKREALKNEYKTEVIYFNLSPLSISWIGYFEKKI